MRKNVFVLLAICILVIATVLYRSAYETSSEERMISNSGSSNDIDNPITEEEPLAMFNDSTQQTLKAVSNLVERYPDSNGGVSIEDNYIIVRTVGASNELTDQLSRFYKEHHILVRPVQYSLKQLQETKDIIWNDLSGESFVAANYIDIENNQIVFILNDKSDENIKKITDLLPDEHMANIVEGTVTIKDQAA